MKTKNEAFIPKKNEPRGTYILQALDEHFRNGDAYTTDDEAIHICMQAARGISYRQLRSDMDYLISTGKLVFEAASISPKLSGIIGFVLTIFVSIRTSKISKILKHNQLTDQYNKERQAFQRTFEGHRNSITVDGLRSNKLLKRHSTEC